MNRLRLVALILAMTLLAAAATAALRAMSVLPPRAMDGPTAIARTDSICFMSGADLVSGNMRMPAGNTGPWPAVILVRDPAERGPTREEALIRSYVRAGFAVLTCDWGNVGSSAEGSNTREPTLLRDHVLDGIAALRRRGGVHGNTIVLHGCGRGGAIALHAAARSHHVSAAVVDLTGLGEAETEAEARVISALALGRRLPVLVARQPLRGYPNAIVQWVELVQPLR